jgi:hypothetical protein
MVCVRFPPFHIISRHVHPLFIALSSHDMTPSTSPPRDGSRRSPSKSSNHSRVQVPASLIPSPELGQDQQGTINKWRFPWGFFEFNIAVEKSPCDHVRLVSKSSYIICKWVIVHIYIYIKYIFSYV